MDTSSISSNVNSNTISNSNNSNNNNSNSNNFSPEPTESIWKSGDSFSVSERENFINQINFLSNQIFSSNDPNQISKASEQLNSLSTSAGGFFQCRLILEHSNDNSSRLVAARSLLTLISNYWNSMMGLDSVELNQFLISFLFSNAENLMPIIVAVLTQCVGRVCKLGWLIHSEHGEIISRLLTQLDPSVDPVGRSQVITLSILIELLDDMNSLRTKQSYSDHRKIARAFRDTILLPLFTALTKLLQDLASGIFNAKGVPRNLAEIITQKAVQVASSSLRFDFIGLASDYEGSETILQIPASWRSTIENGNHVRTIMELLPSLSSEKCITCIEFLVDMAFIRRSLFSSDITRQTHLDNLLTSSLNLMTSSGLLSDENFYHATVTFLSAIIANFPLTEINASSFGSNFFKALINFTSSSFSMYSSLSQSSVVYLLSLWSHIAHQLPSLSESNFPRDLQNVVTNIALSFLQTRLDNLMNTVSQGPDDLLEAFEPSNIETEMKHVPLLCRYDYTTVGNYLSQRIDPLIDQYKQALSLLSSSNNTSNITNQVSVIQSQLAYILSVLGSCIVQERAASLTDSTSNESMDAQLSAYFFQIMHIVNTQPNFPSSDPVYVASTRIIVLAALDFLMAFYRRYLQFPHASYLPRDDRGDSMIWTRLSQWLGPTTHHALLQAIVTLLMFNLTNRHDELIIKQSLQILESLASGFTTGPVLANSESIQQLTVTHKPGELTFITLGVSVAGRLQQRLYLALATLVFRATITKNYTEAFLQPFDELFQGLSKQTNFRVEAVSNVTISLCRSLQGVVSASHGSASYRHLFDWIKPYIPILLRLIETWWDKDLVSSSALKLFAELVHNKSQRIRFLDHSPNGIILFQEVSKVVAVFCSRLQVLQFEDPESELYKKKIKSLQQILKISVRALGGTFTNFGIMSFYKDHSLQNMLKALFPIIMSIRLPDLISYHKASTQYFNFLSVLFEHHTSSLVALDNKIFMALLSSLYEGLHHLDASIVATCANSLDFLFSWFHSSQYVNNDQQSKQERNALQNHFSVNNAFILIVDILSTILNGYLFEYVETNFSLPKPAFSISISFPEAFVKYEQRLIQTQPPNLTERLKAAIQHILKDVQPNNLENSNRDKFMTNLAETRVQIASFAIHP